ncbi:MAG: glycosyltransferase family 4 protein [Flavobacteriales bacterium]|nr:glycosyltransferase family 4 protein [Flavobacteriales bacterium]
MPSILFIASHRKDRAPGQRFRFEQYFGHLERNGFRCELSHLVSEQDDAVLYRKGHYLDKARFVRRCHRLRKADLARMQEFDIVFIFREALMTRSIAFEKAFRKGGARIVFDFDDSIWLSNVSDANRRWAWLKDPDKTSRIIALSDLVFAGNPYLADYARGYNPNVQVVPTTIDTDEYLPVPVRREGPVCIGWSGSITTIQHFQHALPFLRVLKESFGDRVTFRVIGDGTYREPSLGIEGMPWRKDTELRDLAGIDIGIMPLPDDPWARGKCGLKGLQYMALGMPTIMSPVGVNTEIIQDGVNGYLADTTDEWVRKLSLLVEDADLRSRMGAAARRTVEERYSVNAWRDSYLTIFKNLIEERPKRL